jgi:hypothetical protein
MTRPHVGLTLCITPFQTDAVTRTVYQAFRAANEHNLTLKHKPGYRLHEYTPGIGNESILIISNGGVGGGER